MTAVDTNILVRLLTGDDPKQARAAKSLFEDAQIWIAKTVLLETGWVLRSLYGFNDAATCDAFTKLLGLENVHAEDERSVRAAFALIGHGSNSPIHLTSRPPGSEFVSFDQTFVRRAKRVGVTQISGVGGRDR